MGQQTVLIVDDEQRVLDSYRLILAPEEEDSKLTSLLQAVGAKVAPPEEKPRRFRVIESLDGEEALEKHLQECAAGRSPAVALVDMRMPLGIDGLETALRLRKQDAGIHIIVISAYSDVDSETIQLALQHDFLFMNKPVIPDELYHIVCSAADSYDQGRQHQLKKELSLGSLSLDESARERVLLVDDEPMILKLGKATLSKYLKVDVLMAESGEEALRLAEEQRPNLILLDIHMPNMDGLEVCRQLKAAQKTRDIPVIFLTADKTDQMVLDGFKAGAVDYINKPFSAPILIARVSTHLNLYRKSRRLEVLSNTDTLTELPNRAAFQTFLQMQMMELSAVPDQGRGREEAGNGHFTLLFIDLDHFKSINDEKGHEVGDQLLRAVAERLRKNVRDDDLVARLGGDEFVVMLLGALSAEDVAAVANKMITLLSQPFRLKHGTVHIGSSIGSARFPLDATEGEALLRYADMAMYQAKAQGRNCYIPFSNELEADLGRRMQRFNELTLAIEQEQLSLKFQPKMDLQSGEITGLDALLRWNHPQQGELSAEAFVDLLMEGNLGQRAERLILKQTCQQILHCAEHCAAPVEVTVNLSRDRFTFDEPERYILEVAEEVGLPEPLIGQLGVDIHESLLMESPELTLEKLQQLKAVGVRVYLDQFGSGCAAVTTLNKLPLDGIKLSRELVQQIGDPEAELVLKMTASMAHLLEIPLIAVGIESEQQSVFLQQIGCQEGVGFHFHPALDVQQLSEVLV